jgi:hypothetical protein
MNPDVDKTLLDALRERAWKRNSVRLEQRQNTKNGFSVPNDQLDSWKAFQLAEMQVTEALIRWEAAEGIPD